MKFFRKKKILFKLILTLCIGIITVSFATNNTYVYAADDNKSEKCEQGHYKVHSNEEATSKKSAGGGMGSQGVEYTFGDGCKKTVVSSGNSETITWKYHDGTTEEQKEKVEGETNTSAVDDVDEEWSPAIAAGKLLTPIFDFLMAVGDAIMGILQKQIMGTSAVITLDFSVGLLKIIVGIVAAVFVFAVLTVVTGGIATVIGGIGGAIGAFITAAGTSGIVTVVLTAVELGSALYGYKIATAAFSSKFLPDITVFPTYSISPEEIFEGRLLIFDVNFFTPKTLKVHLSSNKEDYSHDKNEADYNSETDGKIYYYYYEGTDGKPVITSKQNTALQLSAVISSWYYAIRNFALVIMMLILIYVGIRMMISSVAAEKSKYKKMLGDWVISMCLVFLLHYIMVFLVNINEDIVNLVNKATDKDNYAIALDKVDQRDTFVEKIEGNSELRQGLVDANGNELYNSDGSENSDAGEATRFIWPVNLLGQIRMMAQMQDGSVEYIGYSIAFLVLVFYTLFFAVTYLKRVIYMAFLTVIAPLVAMTYSIDKMADGKAQAFNMWLKEYMFNLLIQPVHLLLYMILVNMAFELASQNIIYTLVALGFMMPAEKLVRSMFGLDKAKTPGFLAGATGAALTMSTLQGLNKFAGRGPGPKNNSSNKGATGALESEERGATSGYNLRTLYQNNQDNKETREQTEGADGHPVATADSNINDSATMPDLDLQEGSNPRLSMQKEELESQIANGEISEDELTDEQRRLLGLNPEEEENLEGEVPEDRKAKEEDDVIGMRLRRQFGTKEAWKNIGKNAVSTTLRGGVKTVGTAVGAGIGAAAGIASGDPNSVVKNVGLGGTAGNSIGTGVANALTAGFDERYEKAKIEYEKDKYGADYKEHKQKALDDKFRNDSKTKQFYAQEFKEDLRKLSGKEREKELDNIMEQALEYRQYGVTDDKIIVKAMKLDESGNITESDSKAAAMMATKAKDRKSMKEYKEDLSKYVKKDRADSITKKAMQIGNMSLE